MIFLFCFQALLKIEDIDSPPNILHHVQTIFGQLWEGQTQFYTPETFWESFRFWGEPVNLREQHDAFEFFINFTDQIDEKLKSLKKQELFKRTFCGVFVDQKICKECTHTFERDDDFFSLPVTVKCGSLESSLEQFVHTEIMEGDNAYFCEKCNERRTTLKRTCIKRLPPVLTIQLKRFYYDWERSRAIKFNDFFTVSNFIKKIILFSKDFRRFCFSDGKVYECGNFGTSFRREIVLMVYIV